MEKGKWTLNFTLHVDGETSVGDPVNFDKYINLELLATNEQEAEKQTNLLIAEIREACQRHDISFFKKYDASINDEDSIECRSFFLRYIYKKPIRVKIPTALGI